MARPSWSFMGLQSKSYLMLVVLEEIGMGGQHGVDLAGRGRFGLLSDDFSATIAATVSSGLADLDPAWRVSKRLAAIEFPVHCSGNLDDAPGSWCRRDTEEIVKDLVTSEANRKIEKKAGKLFERLLQNTT